MTDYKARLCSNAESSGRVIQRQGEGNRLEEAQPSPRHNCFGQGMSGIRKTQVTHVGTPVNHPELSVMIDRNHVITREAHDFSREVVHGGTNFSISSISFCVLKGLVMNRSTGIDRIVCCHSSRYISNADIKTTFMSGRIFFSAFTS